MSAPTREFEVEKFDVNLTISPSVIRAIDFDLQDGESFEVIFTLEVMESLPIDVWFVNNDNYLLLTSDVQFLYFIDGSQKDVIFTNNIVTFMKNDLYKLTLINYNNQTVNVNVVYEIRTFINEPDGPTPEDKTPLIFPLLIVIIILIIIILCLIILVRKNKQKFEKMVKKDTSKKEKNRKKKKRKAKAKKNTLSKEVENSYLKEIQPKDLTGQSSIFCGYCGNSATTPFCKNCGRKI